MRTKSKNATLSTCIAHPFWGAFFVVADEEKRGRRSKEKRKNKIAKIA